PPRPALFPYTTLFRSGTLDVFSFVVDSSMIDPSSVSIPTTGGSVTAPNGPFFTLVDTVLNGDVRVGDVWRLGLRYKNYEYTVKRSEEHTSELQSRGHV